MSAEAEYDREYRERHAHWFATAQADQSALHRADEDAPTPIWTRPRPPMFNLCVCHFWSSDESHNEGVWEIIGFEEMDTAQEVFILRRFSPAQPSGPTGQIYKAWRGLYEDGKIGIWRRGPDLLDPRFVMKNG